MKLAKKVLICAFVLGPIGIAAAQQPVRTGTAVASGANTAEASLLSVCSPDVQATCPDRQGAALRQCLLENLAKISPKCQAAVSPAQAAIQGKASVTPTGR